MGIISQAYLGSMKAENTLRCPGSRRNQAPCVTLMSVGQKLNSKCKYFGFAFALIYTHIQRVPKKCTHILRDVIYVKCVYIFWHLTLGRLKYIYRVSQEEWTKLRESVPYVKIYRYNPKHLYPKLNGYGDNGQRSLKV